MNFSNLNYPFSVDCPPTASVCPCDAGFYLNSTTLECERNCQLFN